MIADFYITAGEMRQAGIRCHEEISEQTKYRPPSLTALKERVAIALTLREHDATDGKYAELTGDTRLAQSCRRSVAEIDEIITLWRARWRAIAGGRRNA